MEAEFSGCAVRIYEKGDEAEMGVQVWVDFHNHPHHIIIPKNEENKKVTQTTALLGLPLTLTSSTDFRLPRIA
jgi:hypothetical protein